MANQQQVLLIRNGIPTKRDISGWNGYSYG